ncbi:unnamed protein product [Wickerhamomyces anomalus]
MSFFIKSCLFSSWRIPRAKLPWKSVKRELSSIPSSRIPKGYVQPKPKPEDLVVIAMSSGVDSSVAAALYSKEYKNCTAIFMENWSQSDTSRCLEQDWKDAQAVAQQLDLPIEKTNFQKEYWIDVFEPMLGEYNKGITPNPDINCNRYVKFGKLYEYVSEKYKGQNWWLVTGHYSRILQRQDTGEHHLMRPYYKQKDQSYYLSQIDPSVMKRILLPIGHFTKPEVREMAEQLQLEVASKPDSQGLCFISQGEGKFNSFLKNFLNESPGNYITEDGKIWGKHEGLWSATIGQRSRLEMPQGDPKYKGTWFVGAKNFETNDITIVRGTDNPKLFKQIVYVKDFYPLDPNYDLVSNVPNLSVQYRSLQKAEKLDSIVKTDEGGLIFQLGEKRRAIAPGQYLAVYDGDRCIGSGVIEASE